ncbi:MAG TPA: VOC family protein [Devosiaceae bacterium]|jgi:catechol 2,3-dioxygenase-like lactoylglutathione lyase family enzyme
MLSDRRAMATIPAADMERARTWYSEKLGLNPDSSDVAGLIYRLGGGTGFLLYPATSAGQAPNTLMAFESTDVAADVAALKKRGVRFEDYDLPELKTENSIAVIGDSRAAWFKDSEGNILAIGEN